MLRIGKPIGPVGNVSPGPDMRDPVGESVDVALGSVGKRNLASEPIRRDVTLSHQKSMEGYDQFGMCGGRDFAIVGNLADLPYTRNIRRGACTSAHVFVASGMFQDQNVLAGRRAR